MTYDVRFHFPYATVSVKADKGMIEAWQSDLQNQVVFRVRGTYGKDFIINPHLVTYIEVSEVS